MEKQVYFDNYSVAFEPLRHQDRYLVLASQSDKRSEEIVGRLANMFSDLQYSVLYEGVEDESDELRCINMCAPYLQGYRYSKPVPIEDLKNFFSKMA